MLYLTLGPTAPPATQTALIVPVPQADVVVGTHRERLDVAASWGVPAHVTVLYPFVEPTFAEDPETVATMAEAVSTVRSFDCTFGETSWFDDDVLWLAPRPAQPFRDLTSAVYGAFPDYPPYAGAHDGSAPHLTVGERRLGDLADLKRVDSQVRALLPVLARIDRVLLIAGTPAPASWRVAHTFHLPI